MIILLFWHFLLFGQHLQIWVFIFMGLRELWKLKTEFGITDVASYQAASPEAQTKLSIALSQFVWSRLTQIAIVYTLVLIWWYFISAYVHNPYIAWWLPLGMLFSALFMVAGIIQLPLQLFRKMQHVSIALILARRGEFKSYFWSLFCIADCGLLIWRRESFRWHCFYWYYDQSW